MFFGVDIKQFENWWLLSRYLHANKFPWATGILRMSPKGSVKLRCVKDEARKPIELHTGASTPIEFGSSFKVVSNANLIGWHHKYRKG